MLRFFTTISTALLAATLIAPSTTLAQIIDPLSRIEQRQQELFTKVAPSVVFISNGRAFGSGFFVNGNGLILTNAHVVENAKQVDVVLHDGRKLRGTVVELAAEETDLALVKVNLIHTPPLLIAVTKQLQVGSWVASVGHGAGGVWTFTTGMVSNIFPDGASRPVFQTQIPLNPGSSGGPIIDSSGSVIGIVTAGISNSNSINFAIHISLAIQVLRGLREIQQVLTIQAPRGVAVFVDNKLAGTGPTVVVVVESGVHEVFAVIQGHMVKKRVLYPKTREIVLSPD